MSRLYLQIYLGFVGILAFFVFVFWLSGALSPESELAARFLRGAEGLASRVLPSAERSREELQTALESLREGYGIDLGAWSAEGEFLAGAGSPLPRPRRRTESGWLPSRGIGPTAALRLPDGRWIVARLPRDQRPGAGGWLATLAVLAVLVAIAAYPLARRIARRLERLRAGVERIGRGELSTRVPVEGRDEVAQLATSFNRSADRIERLVEAQRTLLASVSHELRSPLARIRVAAELLGEGDHPDLRARIARDVDELDDLIGEMLLASRLESSEGIERAEPIDLLALAAEEGARAGVEVHGEPVSIRGDARLLRKLLRNLLDNAQRHGAGGVEIAVGPLPEGGGLLRVVDAGPGVPEEERERIFEPFYRPAGTGGDGLGLGLALVRRIARHHGGEAHCVPHAGGSCFEVRLPGLYTTSRAGKTFETGPP